MSRPLASVSVEEEIVCGLASAITSKMKANELIKAGKNEAQRLRQLRRKLPIKCVWANSTPCEIGSILFRRNGLMAAGKNSGRANNKSSAAGVPSCIWFRSPLLFQVSTTVSGLHYCFSSPLRQMQELMAQGLSGFELRGRTSQRICELHCEDFG